MHGLYQPTLAGCHDPEARPKPDAGFCKDALENGGLATAYATRDKHLWQMLEELAVGDTYMGMAWGGKS